MGISWVVETIHGIIEATELLVMILKRPVCNAMTNSIISMATNRRTQVASCEARSKNVCDYAIWFCRRSQLVFDKLRRVRTALIR